MSILSSAEYGILRLTINRPARRNTISSDMFRSLAASFEAAAVDPKIRVVLLRGSADIFSAGADFEESLKAPENLDAAMAECFCALRKFPKPVIAQVTGPCVGEAFALLLWCDLVYAGSHALFSLPAVALARSPRFGSGFIMTLAAGYHRAAEKLLLSEPISADEAHDMRLITAVVEDEHIDSVVAAKTARLAVLPPQAVAATKSVMRAARDQWLETGATFEQEVYSRQAKTPEAEEALRAFVEGRKPVFRPNE